MSRVTKTIYPESFGPLINFKPAGFGTTQIPEGEMPFDPGTPVDDPETREHRSLWSRKFINLFDVPMPEITDWGKCVMLVNTPDGKTNIKYDFPTQLSTSRNFSITGDGEAPEVAFNGTQNVVLQLTNLVAAKWKDPITMTFEGPDATGSVAFDGSGNVTVTLNVLNSDNAENANHAETVTLSPDTGNLLQQRENGLYYGAVAPVDVANIYVDAINGNDANIGTRALPMKTIKAALDKGPEGVTRIIYLYEGQTHMVYPGTTTRAVIRGGRCDFIPYGPLLDAIPSPVGDANYNTLDCLALGTTIQSAPFGTVFIGANFQTASALVPFNASAVFHGMTLVAGSNNGSGDPLAADQGSFMSFETPCEFAIITCDIQLPNVDSRVVNPIPAQSQKVVWSNGAVSGTGKIASGVNNNVIFINRGSRTAEATLATYFSDVTKSTDSIYNMSTNLNPSLFP